MGQPVDDPLIGKVIRDYRIERVLSRGTTESLYRATQLSVARPVAIRILAPAAAADPRIVQGFVDRARRAGRLRHPAIVEFHELVSDGSLVFYSTEHVSGGTILEQVELRGAVSWSRLLPKLGDIADAFWLAEQQGLGHGSLSPRHLFFTLDDRIKVSGLGFRELGSGGSEPGLDSTPPDIQYVAPEQLRHGHVAPRTDAYSLGCICYFAMTATPPFAGRTREEVLAAKRLHRMRPLGKAVPDLPDAVARVVETMMALTPERRFQSFLELGAALSALRRERTGGAGHFRRTPGMPARPARSRSPYLAAGAALLALAIAATAFLLWPPGKDAPPSPGTQDGPTGAQPAEPAIPPGATARSQTELPPATPPEPTPEKAASDIDAAIAGALRDSREGRHRAAIAALEEIARRATEPAERVQTALAAAREAASAALRSASDQADRLVAEDEAGQARALLERLATGLPEDLAAVAARKIADVSRALASRDLDAALGAAAAALADLDGEGAAAALEGLPESVIAVDPERVKREREGILRSNRIIETLRTAGLPEWSDLEDRIRRAAARDATVIPALFPVLLIETAATASAERLRRMDPAAAFHGEAAFGPGDTVELRYEFSAEDELLDFALLDGDGSSASMRNGALELIGELRLLRGDPFRGGLTVRLVVTRFDADAPNINVALWTGGSDRVTFRSPGGATTGPRGDEDPSAGYLAFCLGYSPANPLVPSLKTDAGSRLLFPCVAVMGGRSARMLHDSLRWDCLWGENLLVEPKGTQTVELSVAGDAISWTWNARRLHADLPPATADALRKPAMEERRGSLTLFTNGRRLAVDSLMARGRIDETWLQGRCFEEAVRRLEKRLPGIPWGETRHQGDGPRSGPEGSR